MKYTCFMLKTESEEGRKNVLPAVVVCTNLSSHLQKREFQIFQRFSNRAFLDISMARTFILSHGLGNFTSESLLILFPNLIDCQC